jgi:hypothetical protein
LTGLLGSQSGLKNVCQAAGSQEAAAVLYDDMQKIKENATLIIRLAKGFDQIA